MKSTSYPKIILNVNTCHGPDQVTA